MRRTAFERLVAEALRGLPEEFRSKLVNLAVVVEDRPTRRDLQRAGLPPHATLLGLYIGVPLTERGSNYGGVLPDKIVIFKAPIEALCRTDEEVRRTVQETVRHEIGHYFGLGEAQLATHSPSKRTSRTTLS
jgi:predicted Zn-dependent protease with MMP-like domain